MIIDTDTAKTTEEAAQELGVSTSKLRDLMAKNDVTIGKWGTQLAFTPSDITRLRGLVEGRCPKCGYKHGEDTPDTFPSPEATEDTPQGTDAADGTLGGV